ncbi:hypothetical protein [Croceimicrobium sp.]|uniref:hypothetical protein n=1 Tax=Croceimicrobium sp. TaxID=2828340 RepID=UPI003BADA575
MNKVNLKSLIPLISAITMVAGLLGMFFCFPFLWSANMADLVGAGFPFVAGSVLFGAGLISLSLTNREGKDEAQ